MIATVEELKRNSFLCENGMLVIDECREGKIRKLSVPNDLKRIYSTRSGMLAFFDEEGKLYITKWTSDGNGALENNDYKRIHFQIPFCDGTVPYDVNLEKKLEAVLG